MKKLLVLLSLFLFFFGGEKAQAQEDKHTRNESSKQQFVKTYTIAMFYKTDGTKSNWENIQEARVFFNYGNKSDKVKIYFANNVINLTQISETRYDKTKSGLDFAELHLLDDKTGEEILLIYYQDSRYGIMLCTFDGSCIQLSNSLD